MHSQTWTAAGCLLMVWATAAQAQNWHFQWQTGQVLTYRVEHVTTVAETIAGAREQTTSRLKLVKQWKVLNVAADGTATLQLSLASMRNEQVRPNGETILFDSANPDKSTPGLKEQMMKFIGTPLAELRVDTTGKVIGAKQGGTERYEAEPPFQVILPSAPAKPGEAFERQFTIVLNPPQGTGEKYPAVQNFLCKEITGNLAKLEMKTTVKDLPASLLDQVPLFAKQPAGEVVFDTQSGRLHSAHLRIVRDLQGHQGKDSSYHFESDYREEYVPAAAGK